MEAAPAAVALEYFGKVRGRTLRVARAIPPEHLEWSPAPGRFTLGDLARHIAATGRYTFAENIAGRPNRYPGLGRDLADGFDEVLAFLARMHEESMAIFEGIPADEWNERCTGPDHTPITRWKLLRLAIEHEIHHRGQIYFSLGLLGVTTPPLFGLTAEQLRERAEIFSPVMHPGTEELR